MSHFVNTAASRFRFAAAVCAIGVSLSATALPAHSDDINDQVADASGDLARADAKVEAAISKLDNAREKLPAARQELAAAQTDLATSQQRKARADVQVAEAIAAVAQAKQDLAKMEQQIAFLEARIGRMAREVYTNGGEPSEVEVLLDSEDPGDFATRLAALRSIAAGNNNTLLDLESARAQLATQLAKVKALEEKAKAAADEAEREVAAAAEAKARADAAKATVDGLIADRASALRDAKSRKAAVRKQYDKLKAEQDRIAAIARAAAAKSTGPGSLPSSIGPSGLAWPVTGAPLVQGVGPRVHPVYGYRSCHTGIDIGAGSGAPIQSVADGIVVSVASGGPYGNHTVVQHADGISSMYAHQASFAVSQGDRVKRGEAIGYVGSTGWVTGPHLHFEIHVNGTPYDAMGWYGGSKSPVAC